MNYLNILKLMKLIFGRGSADGHVDCECKRKGTSTLVFNPEGIAHAI
jgi:hypothetical protein